MFLWVVGEFGAILKEGYDPSCQKNLPKVPEASLITLVENILLTFEDNITQEIGLNTAVKIWNRCQVEDSKTRIRKILNNRKAHKDFETQIRANEYKKLLGKNWAEKRDAVLEPIPPPLSTNSYINDKQIGAMDLQSISNMKLPSEPKKLALMKKRVKDKKVDEKAEDDEEKVVDLLGDDEA